MWGLKTVSEKKNETLPSTSDEQDATPLKGGLEPMKRGTPNTVMVMVM